MLLSPHLFGVLQACDSVKQDKQECGNHLIVKPPQCLCSDVPVQGGGTRTTCAQQYNVGNCGQAFLKDSIEDIPEGMNAALSFAKARFAKNRFWCCCDAYGVTIQLAALTNNEQHLRTIQMSLLSS